MDFTANKKSGVPLYIQIREYLANEIRNNRLRPGQQMPTERELANTLGTSRNTVSSAYRLLEQEGLLISQQGRGTFVEDNSRKDLILQERLLVLIDSGLEQALQAGLSTTDYISLVQERVREKEEFMKRICVVFVECNIEQAGVFAKELGETTGFTVYPLTLADLRRKAGEAEKVLHEARLIFTTFSHADEVRELTLSLGKGVHGLAVKPCLEGIVKIARYEKGTRFGLISLSSEFQRKFERNLNSAGLGNLAVDYTTSQDVIELSGMIDRNDVIIVSPGRCQEIKTLVAGRKEVIVFNTTLDLGSVKAIMANLTDGSGGLLFSKDEN